MHKLDYLPSHHKDKQPPNPYYALAIYLLPTHFIKIKKLEKYIVYQNDIIFLCLTQCHM